MTRKWPKPHQWRYDHEPPDAMHVTCCLKEWRAMEAVILEARNLVGSTDSVVARIDYHQLIAVFDALDEGRKGRK